MRYLVSVILCGVIALVAAAAIKDPDNSNFHNGYVAIPFTKVKANPDASEWQRRSFWKRANGYESVTLYDQTSFYSVQINVGSPSQEVSVMLDTGSSDLYVVEPSNPYCDADAGESSSSSNPTGTSTSSSSSSIATVDCAEYGTFDPSKSSSFTKNDSLFSIVYGDYDFASGYWGVDNVGLGNMTVKNVNFAIANKSNASFGTFGVGLPKEESTYNGGHGSYTYDNFPVLLKQQGFVKKTAYSLLIENSDAEKGTVLFGAVDHNRYSGQLYTLPLINPDYTGRTATEFYVTVQGIAVEDGNNTETLTTTPFPALIDSGTTEMIIPLDYLKIIAKKFNYEFDSSVGAYTGACPTKNSTNFIFEFGGFTISNDVSNYIALLDSNSATCFLKIYDSGSETAIFGDVFLVDTYAVFDLDDLEISLGQASLNGTGENIEVISSSIPGAIKAPGYSSTWSTSQAVSTGGDIYTVDSTTTSSTAKKNSAYRSIPSSFFLMSSFLYSLVI